MLGRMMEREIGEQVGLLRSNIGSYGEQLRSLSATGIECILLVARGSSDHAALFARYLFEIELGIPVFLAAPSVLTRYRSEVRYPKCLAIGISQSGAAPDVAEVIRHMREAGHPTLAITNTIPSRLSTEAEFTLDLQCGVEESVAATKTYNASLLAILAVAERLGARFQISETKMPDEDWLETCRQLAAEGARKLQNREPVFSLGRGYSFATAMESALKLMECALLPCKAYSVADFEHGPKALSDEGSALICYSDISVDLANQGATILRAPVAEVPERFQPLWQIMFAQCLALECARLRGLDPDKPQFIRKVTKTL